ncbi:nicotinamide mononucleotide adenylyl transferase [Niveomyces insectorum RCEF 264]|uniref:Nicotinamide-nucleotide adenylyltransferase n=1 Tax=Niveomyces insectorum RCEF 264 TaxID=1081102 RepID=A0A167X0Z1_9HYPO|nr:nicotinamide mononucleotide adenylyl transferase [Niveomyces insectorum RCEF 264]
MSSNNIAQQPPLHQDQQLEQPQLQQQQPQNESPSSSSSSSTHSPSQNADAPSAEPYHLPTHRLRTLQDPNKTPLVLVVCGSFSPITIMHLRMCEMASDWVRMVEDNYEVVGIYLSPVSDAYKKANLAAAHHRIRMCELAVEDTTNCVMVDPWEANQPRYVPTAQVLDHFRSEINGGELGGIVVAGEGQAQRRPARVALLCGADLMHSMSTPGLWSPDDLDRILGEGGLYVVERHGTDLEEAKEALSQWADHISVIPQGVPIDLSSTKVRLFLHKKMSVRYFVPNSVIEYIVANGLYGTSKEEQAGEPPSDKGKAAVSVAYSEHR